MVNGRRITVTLQADNEAAAILEVLTLQSNPATYDQGTWSVEVERYLAAAVSSGRFSPANASKRRYVLLAAARQMDIDSPRRVTPAIVRDWHDALREKFPRSTTPASYLSYLRGFLSDLCLQGRLHADPTREMVSPPRQDAVREVFLTSAEVARLYHLAESRPVIQWILLLGCECGMRRSEIASCRPEWFDLLNGTVTIPATDLGSAGSRFERKGQTGRRRSATIPLSRPVREMIDLHGLLHPYVIRPEIPWGKWRYRFEFRGVLRRFLKKHGHQDVTVHDLRRSFGSNRISAGVSLEKVANWMGIRRDTAWKHYARFIPADKEIDKGAAW